MFVFVFCVCKIGMVEVDGFDGWFLFVVVFFGFFVVFFVG